MSCPRQEKKSTDDHGLSEKSLVVFIVVTLTNMTHDRGAFETILVDVLVVQLVEIAKIVIQAKLVAERLLLHFRDGIGHGFCRLV